MKDDYFISTNNFLLWLRTDLKFDDAFVSFARILKPNGHTNISLGECICRVAKWLPNRPYRVTS